MNFQPIDLSFQAAYRERLAACPQPASDYCFVNLWGWAEEYGLAWAWSDDLVWIRQERPAAVFWAPVGSWPDIDWNKRLAEFRGQGIPLHRVPEALVRLWERQLDFEITVTEDRGQWDYVYALQELRELKGNRYHKKKNLLNQFRKKYASRFEPFHAGLVDRALAMQEDWCTWRDCDSSRSLASENRVIQKILENWDQLPDLSGGVLVSDRSLIAYTVGEVIRNDMLVIHAEKGDPSYRGVYQAVNQMFLASLEPGIRWVNREQDLGDDGLRQAKMSYHPSHFIKKYTVLLQR